MAGTRCQDMTSIHRLASIDNVPGASGRVATVLNEHILLVGTRSHVDAVAAGPRRGVGFLNGRPGRTRACPIVSIVAVCCNVEVPEAAVEGIVKKRLAGAGSFSSPWLRLNWSTSASWQLNLSRGGWRCRYRRRRLGSRR